MQRILLLLAVVVLGCAQADEATTAPPPEIPYTGSYTTDGRYIRDGEGRAVLLHGINWDGRWKGKPYGADATAGEAERIAALGLNSVRMLVHWGQVFPEKDGVINTPYVEDFRRRVRLAAAAGLLVVVDMHQDIFGYGIRNTDGDVIGNGAPAWACSAVLEPISPWFLYYLQDPVAECYDRFYSTPALIRSFAEAHRTVMQAVGDIPAVVGFEIINEPHFGTASPMTVDGAVLQPFYEQVYAHIATAAAGHLLFFEPSTVKNLAAFTTLTALPRRHSVYAPHVYHPAMEGGEPYDGNTFFIRNRIEVDQREADFLGAPLWWGEWGNAPTGESSRDYVNDFLDLADAGFVGRAYWDYAQIQRTDRPDGGSFVAAGLARAYVERAPGAPAFDYDAATRTLQVSIVGDGAAQTWVRAPNAWTAKVTLLEGWSGAVTTTTTGFLRLHLPPASAGARVSAEISFDSVKRSPEN